MGLRSPLPLPPPPSQDQEKGRQSISKSKASSSSPIRRELNIYNLIDPDTYGKDPERDQFTLKVVERLFANHFKESPLYQELSSEDSNLVAHFFQALRERGREIKLNFGTAQWVDLAQIPLQDDRYQALLYQVLKGEKLKPTTVEKAFLAGEQIPLLNSLRIQKRGDAIRLYTATPPLLQALAEADLDLAPIMVKKREIRRALRRKQDKQELSIEWKETLKGAGLDLPDKLVNYEVVHTGS